MREENTKKKTLPLIALGVALLLSLAACERETEESGENDNESEARVPVAAAEIVERDLSRMVRMAARVEPRVTIDLASRTSGSVDTVFVEEGDAVERGDLLASLDMSEEQAELSRAQAAAEEVHLEYERTAELLDRGDVTQAEYERVRAERRAAEGEVLLWETRLTFGRIGSPRDAVVSERMIEPGEAVSAQDELFELVDMQALVMKLGVSEMDVVHLERGQSVDIQLDAMPDNSLEGEIRRIFPTAERASRLVTVEVALPEDAHEQGVRPGFLGRVAIPVDERPESLAVPSNAIGEDGDEHYVYVIEDDTLVRRKVSIGVDRGEWTEVLEGIEEGEIVLGSNPIDMQEGDRVRIVSWRG